MFSKFILNFARRKKLGDKAAWKKVGSRNHFKIIRILSASLFLFAFWSLFKLGIVKSYGTYTPLVNFPTIFYNSIITIFPNSLNKIFTPAK